MLWGQTKLRTPGWGVGHCRDSISDKEMLDKDLKEMKEQPK